MILSLLFEQMTIEGIIGILGFVSVVSVAMGRMIWQLSTMDSKIGNLEVRLAKINGQMEIAHGHAVQCDVDRAMLDRRIDELEKRMSKSSEE